MNIVYFRQYLIILMFVILGQISNGLRMASLLLLEKDINLFILIKRLLLLSFLKVIGTYHSMSRNLYIKLFHFFSHRRWYWYLQSHFEQRLGRGFHRGKISFVWSSTIQRKNWRSKNWNWCSFQNQGFGKIHESLFLRTYFQNGFSQKLTK